MPKCSCMISVRRPGLHRPEKIHVKVSDSDYGARQSTWDPYIAQHLVLKA